MAIQTQAPLEPPIDTEGKGQIMDGPSYEERERAAVIIQKHYRGHLARRRYGELQLENEAKWNDLVKQSQDLKYAQEQLENKNDVKSRWRRAAQAASRLETGDGLYSTPVHLASNTTSVQGHAGEPSRLAMVEECVPETLDEKERRARRATFWGSFSVMGLGKERDDRKDLPFQSKALEQQHWLEMIDGKHRYGSNMKFYFRKWKEAETSDNFFRWLDKGEGKDLDLEELPRERLETERITYLTAEKRLNYLVKVDKDGLLRWARNGDLVDTAAGQWQDAGDGGGIIPAKDGDEEDGDDVPVFRDPYAAPKKRLPKPKRSLATSYSHSNASTSSFSSDSWSAQSSDLDENEDTHYIGLDKANSGSWLSRHRKKMTPGGVRKELLRKTVRRNTWIYVSDMKMNMFIGMKKSGTFQHSSFLAGGKVSSAGIIVVKHGLIKSLNPLSGHYRSSIDNFRSFIAQLEGLGIDLSHVKVAKSVLSLWGLSKYSKATKAQKDVFTHMARALHLSHNPTEEEKSQAVKDNAEREDREHMERMQRLKEAETQEDEKRKQKEEAGVEEDEETEEQREESMRRMRKEVLYGRQQENVKIHQEKKEDTEQELRPV
ncbi:hypothetical protein L202_05364 [Cryptococcus amylolentus CBS 6039]|uniref:IQ domain-containing calmodulin-binding protein n=2 Tax=Cryptococcus amylolentus CBS 6039 TaxID=1295533 RepID=A0A1E3HK96_9TREE|nr:hypothetical protein L202_05364 [Cryptococcus amylolentus CBS 6039]ODN76749.1 hypothetical protein L202_05364 [Cryptococcus amylolentus CBS 6039]